MGLTSSGQISLGDIQTEIGDSAQIKLSTASDGTLVTINTANASSDRPDGAAPHSMSEWYSYNHIFGDYGNSSNTEMFSGNQGTGLVSVNGIDLSSADYVGSSIIGKTGHIYFRFESGTSFRSDAQVRRINYNSNQRFSSFATAGVTGIQTTSLTTNAAYDHSATFINVATATTAGRWNHLNGTPGSSGTGVNGDTIYYESSGAGSNKDVYLRFPEITFSANTIDFSGYGYGSNMGTLFLGVFITG
jgi:hypothetical protein|tara:strand:+ start:316 stop:1053 length:738 start_codon:yes stop_codon:yes gene_type:complete